MLQTLQHPSTSEQSGVSAGAILSSSCCSKVEVKGLTRLLLQSSAILAASESMKSSFRSPHKTYVSLRNHVTCTRVHTLSRSSLLPFRLPRKICVRDRKYLTCIRAHFLEEKLTFAVQIATQDVCLWTACHLHACTYLVKELTVAAEIATRDLCLSSRT